MCRLRGGLLKKQCWGSVTICTDPDADSEYWYIYLILNKKSQRSYKTACQGFSYYFCFMMEGCGAGSVLVTNGSGCGSGRP
jgi:hypothetical protein